MIQIFPIPDIFNEVHLDDAKKYLKQSVKVLKDRNKGWQNWFLNGFSWITRDPKVLGMPYNIGLEPTNYCNLGCDVCETGSGNLNREEGMMSFDNYKRLIDSVTQHTNTIYLYFMGETFLHPHAYEMVEYASERDIFVDTCTNGDAIKPEKLIDSGINRISFQIGGLDQKTHETYRENSDIERVLSNLEETLKIRRAKGKESESTIDLGFIVMEHNTDQIPEAKKLGETLGVDNVRIIDPCVRNVEQGERYLPDDEEFWIYDKQEFEENGRIVPKHDLQNSCSWIWFSCNIHWNGDVVPCCRDAMGQFVMGNVFEDSLKEIWNNQSYREFRKAILTKQSQLSICKYCNGFGFPGVLDADLETEKNTGNQTSTEEFTAAVSME